MIELKVNKKTVPFGRRPGNTVALGAQGGTGAEWDQVFLRDR